MAQRNSIIKLAKGIKLDKDYKQVLNYSESQMLDMINNSSHLVYTNNTYSFLRDEGTIQVQAPYGTVIQANYMAFQNPDYSNKWVFAFIDEVIYKGELNTEIKYTIDVWSTWFQYWSAKACYVVREHVVDDSIGANTVPEGLETGEYIINGIDYMMYDVNYYIIMSLSDNKIADNNYLYSVRNRTYSNVYSGDYLYVFTSANDVSDMITLLDHAGKGSSINYIYMIPGTVYNKLQKTDTQTATYSTYTASYRAILPSNFINIESEKTISMQTTLNGYTPKNNKLKCFPYNFIEVTNNNGASIVYHYEKFVNNIPKFNIDGALTPGLSIRCYPLNYNKLTDTTPLASGIKYGFNDGIPAGKYPTCSWKTDVYVNWLTQTGVNRSFQTANTLMNFAGNVATGNLGGALDNVTSIFGTAVEMYQHSLTPDTTGGNTNTGDVSFGTLNTLFQVNKKSIKSEYARIIDDYLSRLGYKVNRTKVPNMGHREHFNFVQIANEETTAYANNHNNICPPASDLKIINDLFRRGITIWNSHSSLGNFSVSNNIT